MWHRVLASSCGRELGKGRDGVPWRVWGPFGRRCSGPVIRIISLVLVEMFLERVDAAGNSKRRRYRTHHSPAAIIVGEVDIRRSSHLGR